jgi:tetratricopeptide (TPR) repeat protein
MKETEFDTDLKKAITAEHRKELKEDFRSLEASLSNSKKGSSQFNWRIAASVIILVGLGSWFFLFNQNPSPEQLYNQYFSPYENVIAPIVRDQVKLDKKAQAFAFYEQGQYEKAIESLDALTPQDSLDALTIKFYKANAYLELEKFDKSKLLFEQVVAQNKEWQEESLWYLGLIALKDNEVATSISYLTKLQKDNAAFKHKAKALLKELE